MEVIQCEAILRYRLVTTKGKLKDLGGLLYRYEINPNTGFSYLHQALKGAFTVINKKLIASPSDFMGAMVYGTVSLVCSSSETDFARRADRDAERAGQFDEQPNPLWTVGLELLHVP